MLAAIVAACNFILWVFGVLFRRTVFGLLTNYLLSLAAIPVA
jgi:hypothetical protein